MKFSVGIKILSLGFSASAFVPSSIVGHRRSGLSMVATAPSSTSATWSPKSWRSKPGTQMPVYDDEDDLKAATDKIKAGSPLVFAGEVRQLKEELAKISEGEGFLLMGGDCAESFAEFSVNHVRDTFRVMLQMALVLTYGGALPVTKVGRMAGQFAKPRSAPDETRDGVTLPSYRGDIVNREEFTEEARKNDPWNMMEAYTQSAHTLNLLRAFTKGGYADIARLQAWNLDFVANTNEGSRYRQLADKVNEALRFMKAIGINTSAGRFKTTDFYTSHECLLLEYEESLTRQDSITNDWYDCSSHMLWVGERTREPGYAHLEFCSGVQNPLGCKISEKCTPDDLMEICDTLNPDNIPGKLTIIVRMGAENVKKTLPGLIETVQKNGKNVVWISDPCHGNTRATESGYKTRDFDAIRDELESFFDVHAKMGTHAGGVHIEMTGEDVTECVGGISDVTEETLKERYMTTVDPRVNGSQALELAFLIAEKMREKAGLAPLTIPKVNSDAPDHYL